MTAGVIDGINSLAKYLGRTGHEDVSWNARVLDRTTDQRMVVEYSVRCGETANRTDSAAQTFIGKFYSDDTGQVCFKNMQAVRSALVQSSRLGPLSIPQPFHYDHRVRFLIQQRVPGIAFTELIKDEDFRRPISVAAQALAQLHALELGGYRTTQLHHHIDELIRPHPVVLSQHFPQYRSLIEDCLDYLHRQQVSWTDQTDRAPIHRDFQLRQLFFADPSVWLIDWDLFACGDPAFDVAYFVVYLRTHLPNWQSESAIDAFLESYLSIGSSTVLQRLPAYESFNYLRRACRRFRLQDDGWQQQLEKMMRGIESGPSSTSV